MKKSSLYWLLTLVALVTSSCDNYLDINTNPNSATSASAQLVLPQAIVSAANLSSSYNGTPTINYGTHFGGYVANAGGFSGFGNLLNYNIVPDNYNTLWLNTYDNLQDFKYVIDQTEGVEGQGYVNATAKIMTVLNYARLVDAFGNVPYSEALLGNAGRTPKYDDAATIYQDLVVKLDAAIAAIDAAKFPLALNSSSDPLFKGNMTTWKQFANTLKLRLLVRMSGVSALSSFVNTKFTALDRTLGFLTTDAIVNPGYTKQTNQQNPTWNAWGYSVAGAVNSSSRIPTQFIFGFYKGQKLTDNGRGSVIYKNFTSASAPTPINQLGNESADAPKIITSYSTWYTGTFSSASSISDALGVLKGPSMGQPIMLAAESYFLQAEAQLKGYLPGTFATSFDQGITQSFTYLYKDVTNVVSPSKNVAADVATYKADNATGANNYLVNIALATTAEQRLEAIITQKYIAMNMINSDEGWNEYRRTGYPKTDPNGTGYTNIASNKSNSTRPDKLPTRILYPSSEQSYNAANFKTVNQFADLIFWDPN